MQYNTCKGYIIPYPPAVQYMQKIYYTCPICSLWHMYRINLPVLPCSTVHEKKYLPVLSCSSVHLKNIIICSTMQYSTCKEYIYPFYAIQYSTCKEYIYLPRHAQEPPEPHQCSPLYQILQTP